MKKFLGIPAILLMGLISCNSGSSDKTASADSTTVVQADTSHASMNMDMTAESSLPAIAAGATVSFKNLKDGQTVTSPVKVEMGATGISVDSAGAVKPNSGHFHIIIDAEDSIPSGVVIAKDSAHLHYGDAQKEATLNLPAGKHKLVLQFADGAHRSYGSKLVSEVTVNVK